MMRKRILMASVAVAALVFMLPTTTVQAMNPALGVTPAATTTSTLGATMPAMTSKKIVLQTASYFQSGPTPFDTALQTVATTGEKMKLVGDTEKASVTGIWAAMTRDKVGFDTVKVRTCKFELKTVINRAKHPVITKFVPRQVLYVG